MKDAFLRQAVLQARPKSLFVQGSADPYHDAALLQELQAAAGAALVIPGADHSLESGPDLPAAFAALERLLLALSEFTGW